MNEPIKGAWDYLGPGMMQGMRSGLGRAGRIGKRGLKLGALGGIGYAGYRGYRKYGGNADAPGDYGVGSSSGASGLQGRSSGGMQ